MLSVFPRFSALSQVHPAAIRQDGAVILHLKSDDAGDLQFPPIEGLRPSDLPGYEVKLTIRPERDTMHGRWPVYDVEYSAPSNRNPGMNLIVPQSDSYVPLHRKDQFATLRQLFKHLSLSTAIQTALGAIIKGPSQKAP